MSFILDALKKSDKNRPTGKVPTLVTSHRMEVDSRRRRPQWPLLLVLLLTVNAAILLWLFGPWSQPEISSPRQIASAISVEKKSPEGSVTPIAARVSEVVPESIDERLKPVTDTVSVLPARAKSGVEAAGQNGPGPQQEQASSADVEIIAEMQALQGPFSTTEQAPRLYNLSDLPPAVRRDIPEMRISLHAYFDDVQQRLVSINHKLLREGGLLDGKYLLEEITADGVIFSYAGYRFQVLFKSSRF